MNTHYGIYGGQYVAETLTGALRELEKAYFDAKEDPAFQAELDDLLRNYVGRESPLYFAKRLTEHCGGARIFRVHDVAETVEALGDQPASGKTVVTR